MKTSLNSKSQKILAGGVLFFSLVIIFRKYLLFSELFLFIDVGSDTMSLFYPELIDHAGSIRNEGSFFWSFSKSLGHSNWTANYADPLFLILIALGKKYLAYGLGWVNFLKVLLTGIFAYKLFRLTNFEKSAACIGAILLCYSGYLMVGVTWFGHATNIMYMTLFLLGLELTISKNKWYVLPFVCLLLLGPSLLFMAEYAVVYLLLRYALVQRLKRENVKEFFIRIWKPIVYSILICGPFLGSVINKMLNSPRVSGQASYADGLKAKGLFGLNDAEHYATIVARFFSNDLIGGPNNFSGWNNFLEAPLMYCGMLTLLLIPQVFQFLKRKQKIVFGSVLIFFLLALIFPFIRQACYLFMGNYYKSGFSFFIPFTLIWIAMVALGFIIKSRKINLPLLTITFIVLMCVMWSVQAISDQVSVDKFNRILVTTFLAVQFLLLFLISKLKYSNWVINILILSVVAEGAVLSYPSLNDRITISSDTFESRKYYKDHTIEVLDYLKSIDPEFYRIEKTEGSFLTAGLNDSQAQAYYDTKSYRSHNHNSIIEFMSTLKIFDASNELMTRWFPGVHTAVDILPLLSLKYLIVKSGANPNVKFDKFDNLGEMNGLNIYKHKYHLPLGIPYSKYILKSDLNKLSGYYQIVESMYRGIIIEDEDVSQYPGLQKFDLQNINGSFDFPSYVKDLAPEAMTLQSFAEDKILGEFKISKPSGVLFSIPFDDGWKAYIDGNPTKLTKVHGGLTGLFLPAGNHQVELKYRPPYFLLGILLFLIGLVIMIWNYKFYEGKKNHALVAPLSYAHIEKPKMQFKSEVKKPKAQKTLAHKKSNKKKKANKKPKRR